MSVAKRRTKAKSTRAQRRPAYTDPKIVVSPKRQWQLIRVVLDGGADGWSAAEGTWDGKPCFAIRWNGGPKSGSPVGVPQSRGRPIWFIVPDQLGGAVHSAVIDEVRRRIAKRDGQPDPVMEELMRRIKRAAEIPFLDTRSDDEILGFDERGLPDRSGKW